VALIDILPAGTGAQNSGTFTCDGIAHITVGLYAGAGGTITEHVGAVIKVETPTGYVNYLDEDGNLVKLVSANPTYVIREAGNFRARKETTATSIGIYLNDGL